MWVNFKYCHTFSTVFVTTSFLPSQKIGCIIIIISFITVFAGVLFVHQPGANHAPRASVTQVNHSVHTLCTFLRIRADPSMQIFWISVIVLLLLLLLHTQQNMAFLIGWWGMHKWLIECKQRLSKCNTKVAMNTKGCFSCCFYYYYTGTPNDRMFPNTPQLYQMVFFVL